MFYTITLGAKCLYTITLGAKCLYTITLGAKCLYTIILNVFTRARSKCLHDNTRS